MEFIRCTLNYNNNCNNIDDIEAAIGLIENINVENKTIPSPSTISIWTRKKGEVYDYTFRDKENALEALMNL